MMRKTTLDYAIRSALFLLVQISHCAQQQTRVLRMDAVRMKKMMLVFAILNAKNTILELPQFAGDIAAISVDQSTLTWAYTATSGGHQRVVTSQGMIEVLVPSLTNPGPMEWDAMDLVSIIKENVHVLILLAWSPLSWNATNLI